MSLFLDNWAQLLLNLATGYYSTEYIPKTSLSVLKDNELISAATGQLPITTTKYLLKYLL